MRVKKDKDSWNAGGVITRDKRHDKSFDGSSAKAKEEKPKKNWCGKKKEKKHKLKIELRIWCKRFYPCVVCTKCHKVFFTDYGMPWQEGKEFKETNRYKKILEEYKEKLGC